MSEIEPYSWESLSSPVIVGVDEVGRGCLAGPVYAAAVRIDTSKPYQHYTDSKKLSARRRETLAKEIQENHEVGVAFASVNEITSMNILRASLLAMNRAISALEYGEGIILVDGKMTVPGKNLNRFRQTPLVKGDLRAHPIAAASIVAKVVRDQWMVEQSEKHPHYGFDRHKGYSTRLHKEAIQKHGPCSLHRPTFGGVKEHLID